MTLTMRSQPTLGVLLTLLFAGWLTSAVAAQTPEKEELPVLQISYVSADAVYLNGGRSHGLEVGQFISVKRGEEPIADLQVAFVSRKSASCRVVDSRLEIRLGDLAVPQALEVEPRSEEAHVEQAKTPRTTDPEDPPETVPSPTPVESPSKTEKAPWGDFSGTISLRWHHFEDGSEFPRSYDQTTARLNLRARSINDRYEARIRIRGREDRRYRESEATETDRRDRLYELAFTYEPPEGKIFLEAGRLVSSPRLGFDYLDGLVAEYKFSPRLGAGGFYGQRSDIEEISLGSDGEAYGAFIHYHRKRSRDSPFYADLLLGGVRELQEGEVSRDYLSIYGRLGSGSRWSVYQRANIDINSDWREEASGDDYQLSNVLTSINYRFTDSLRLGLSYDHRRRHRDFENRDTPEEIFDDRLREGFRVTAQIGDAKGWRMTSSVGVRRQEGEEDAYTGTGSLFHTNIADRNLLLGLDFSGFEGENSEGYRVSLRSRKYLNGGHDIGLTLGTSATTNTFSGVAEETENRWARLNGTARLPKRFFILGEFEVTDGDDLAGERYIFQLGYRL